MIVMWMLYSVWVSALVAVAARAAEEVAAAFGRPRRWVWLTPTVVAAVCAPARARQRAVPRLRAARAATEAR